MWGREMRVGLVFVLVSLLVGGAFREWKHAHEPRFADLVAQLQSEDAAARGRNDRTEVGNPPLDTDAANAPARPVGTGRSPALPLLPSKLDLNRATSEELERLPGIGPALAARIIADRSGRGPFRSPDALLRVHGIGARTLARLRPYLMEASPPADSGSPIAN